MTGPASTGGGAPGDGDAVTLFGHWICPFSVRVEFALAQRGVPYTVVEVPPSAVRPRGFVVPAEFLTNSPRREIPLVRVGNDYLADSIPILEWLETRFSQNPLLPAEHELAGEVRAEMRWIDEHLYRPMIGVYYGTDADRIARASELFGRNLAICAERWSPGEWIAGDGPTLAEALMVAIYVRLDGLARLGLTAVIPEWVRAHMTRCENLPGWPSAHWSAAQTDEFVGRFEKYRERVRENAGRTASNEPA